MRAYESIVRPMHRTMRENQRQSRTLAAIRDALLPKLMSGEVKVGTEA